MGVTRILSLGVFVDQRQLKSRACMHMLDARVCDMFLHNGAFREKNVLTLRAVWKTEKLIEIFYKNGIIYFTLHKRWEKIINEGWSKSNATQLWKLSILSE